MSSAIPFELTFPPLALSPSNSSPFAFELSRHHASDMNELKKKIAEGMKEKRTAKEQEEDLHLTYLDEDGEEVELESNFDLIDAIRQFDQAISVSVTLGIGGALNELKPNAIRVFVRPQQQMWRSSMSGDGEWEKITPPQVTNSQLQPSSSSMSDGFVCGELDSTQVKQLEHLSASTSSSSSSVVEEAKLDASLVAPLTAEEPDDGEVSSQVHAPPATSPSSGWSIFNVFGGRATSSSAPSATSDSSNAIGAPTTNTVGTNTISMSRAHQHNTNPSELMSSSSSSLAESLSSIPHSLTSSLVKEQAERDFWEPDVMQPSSTSSELTHLPGQRHGHGLEDSAEFTSNALSQVFEMFLTRAEERFGIDSSLTSRASGVSSSPSSSAFVRPPHAALLEALRGLDARVFDSLANQFADLCVAHVHEREQRLKQEEEKMIQERVRQLQLQEEEKEREEQRQEQEHDQETNYEPTAPLENSEPVAKEVASSESDSVALSSPPPAVEFPSSSSSSSSSQNPSSSHPPIEVVNPSSSVPPILLAPVDVNPICPRNETPTVIPLVPIPVASPIAPAALDAATRFNQLISELREMGFTDDSLNTYVLQKCGHDLAQAIDWLMTDQATGGELRREMERQE